MRPNKEGERTYIQHKHTMYGTLARFEHNSSQSNRVDSESKNKLKCTRKNKARCLTTLGYRADSRRAKKKQKKNHTFLVHANSKNVRNRLNGSMQLNLLVLLLLKVQTVLFGSRFSSLPLSSSNASLHFSGLRSNYLPHFGFYVALVTILVLFHSNCMLCFIYDCIWRIERGVPALNIPHINLRVT